MSATNAVKAGELLRQAAAFGPMIFEGLHALFLQHAPELVPAQLPERTDEAIKAETEKLIRERFPVAPTSVPPRTKSSDAIAAAADPKPSGR